MPLETKTTWARLRVGLLAMAALVILGVLIFLITSSQGFFRSKSTLYTYFNDSGAIASGAPVRLNGLLVGQVKKVEFSGSNQPGRIVKLTLEVNSEMLDQIPVDSQAETAALSLLSTKYVNIAKGKSPKMIAPGAELASASSPEIADFMKRGQALIDDMQGILGKVNSMLSDIQSGKGTIGKVLFDETMYNRALAIIDQVKTLSETLNSNRGIGQLINGDAFPNDLHKTMARVDEVVSDIQQGNGTLGKFIKDPTLYNEGLATVADLRKSMARIDSMLVDVNAGKGDIGKLFKSEELHEEIKATMGRLDSIMDKMNTGQGTIGQLLVNPSLYESLNGTATELSGFMKEFRKNPKKFLTITVKFF
jgi:phospholipid/cholesterol/gamma-HCH transport system substrate-binding protein